MPSMGPHSSPGCSVSLGRVSPGVSGEWKRGSPVIGNSFSDVWSRNALCMCTDIPVNDNDVYGKSFILVWP